MSTNIDDSNNNNGAPAPAPAANKYFYIIVTKEQTTNKLSIDNIDSTENIPDSDTPSSFITDTNKSGKFAVKVEVKDSTDSDFFQVGAKYYKLVLDQPVTKTDVTNIVYNSTTFAAQPTLKGGQKQVEDQKVDGGQKEKKNNHKNRNYSKKNRKSRSKSDTLRNYFNYNAIETI